MNKTELLEGLALTHDPDAIVITETWLRVEIASDEVFPSSNNVLRNDTLTRGVALLLKKPLKYEPLPSFKGRENVWCQLFLGNAVLLVGIIYRPPGSSAEFFESLDNYLTTLSKKVRIIITGDFNLPGVDWDARIPISTDRIHADSMLETMAKLELIQVVTFPTRIHAESSTMLNLLFLSEGTFYFEIDVKEGISDHKAVIASLKVSNKLL